MRYFVYGRESCPFCCAACDYLYASGLEYHFQDFDDDHKFLEHVKEFFEFETVPIIVENNKETGESVLLGGYTELLERLS